VHKFAGFFHWFMRKNRKESYPQPRKYSQPIEPPFCSQTESSWLLVVCILHPAGIEKMVKINTWIRRATSSAGPGEASERGDE
jgi:hypothetical protein